MISKSFYRIREVSSIVGVPAYTLRYWESEFSQLSPQRTESGQRRYTANDLNLCIRLKELLYDRKMKVEAVKAHINATYRKSAPRNPYQCNTKEDALRLLASVKSGLVDAHFVDRITAVEVWVKTAASSALNPS